MVMDGYILDTVEYAICSYTVFFVRFKFYCSKVLFKNAFAQKIQFPPSVYQENPR